MDAIITAGGIPQPGEPLYEYTQGKNKAMLDVCGSPMIQWVLDALNGSEMVDQVVIVGLPEDSQLECPKIASYLPNQGGMLHNLRAGMLKVKEINPAAGHVLLVSSDIPGIRSEMVNWVVRNAMKTDLDLYYHVIERSVMEARYPGSKRTYTRLKDVEVCGGDMNIARVMTGTDKDQLWERLIAARKNVFKQASIIGWDTLIMMLFHRLTLEKAVEIATKRVHLTGQAVLCPFAEIGMDVDKPFQLDLVCADLEKLAAA
jgi:GTP:adenosylcobinamide-phosphate guanylyltransferase